MNQVKLKPVGDRAVLAVFGEDISEEINGRVTSFAKAVQESGEAGILDIIPAFTSVLINYDPLILSYGAVLDFCSQRVAGMKEGVRTPRRVFEIPVLYGGSVGEDLPYVAQRAGLTEEEVIRIHSGGDYLIYMLGFLPGFVYLGGLDPRIATPRLKRPRMAIPAGSVGIGGAQTGIYPSVSPGGWQLIGNTPLEVYSPKREPAILYEAGDKIKFVPVDEVEYNRIRQAVQAGSYEVTVYQEEE